MNHVSPPGSPSAKPTVTTGPLPACRIWTCGANRPLAGAGCAGCLGAGSQKTLRKIFFAVFRVGRRYPVGSVAALIHDIGDILSPYNHGELAAAMVRPYMSEKTRWIIEHHCVFQGYYYNHHLGGDRNARDKYKDSPYYEDCKYFCHNYDQNAFDPDYPTKPLEFFIPMLRRIFSNAGGHMELNERADD